MSETTTNEYHFFYYSIPCQVQAQIGTKITLKKRTFYPFFLVKESGSSSTSVMLLATLIRPDFQN
jgi:hypothetical protein